AARCSGCRRRRRDPSFCTVLCRPHPESLCTYEGGPWFETRRCATLLTTRRSSFRFDLAPYSLHHILRSPPSPRLRRASRRLRRSLGEGGRLGGGLGAALKSLRFSRWLCSAASPSRTRPFRDRMARSAMAVHC